MSDTNDGFDSDGTRLIMPPPELRRRRHHWSRAARYLKFLLLFIAGTVASMLVAIRNDTALHVTFAEKVLRWERETGTKLVGVKAVLGITLDGSSAGLFQVIGNDDDLGLSTLLNVGIDPNSDNSEGMSALRFAVIRKNTEAINLLVARGVDINRIDGEGETALLDAVSRGDVDMSLHLLILGADANAPGKAKNTPLHVAVKSQNAPLVDILLDRLANPNAEDEQGRTPLLLAVETNNPNLITRLIQRGGNVNARDKDGKTALMHAVIADDIPIVGALLQADTNLNLTDNLGKTVGDYARETGGRVGPLFSRAFDQQPPDTTASADVQAPPAEEANIVATLPEQPTPPVKVGAGSSPSWTGSTGSAGDADAPLKLTRLRLVGRLEGKWERKKKLTLAGVRAMVRNVGDYPAEDIQVKVRVPGGAMLTLTGPRTLGRNEVGEYLSRSSVDVTQGGNLKDELLCANCHR